MVSEEVRMTDQTIRVVAIVLAPIVFVLGGLTWIYLVFGGTHFPALWISLSFFLLFPGLSALAFGCALAAREFPLRWAFWSVLVRLPLYAFLAVLAAAVVFRGDYVLVIGSVFLRLVFMQI
jgi:hypothetical protein